MDHPLAVMSDYAPDVDPAAVRALAPLAGSEVFAEACLRVPRGPIEVVAGFGLDGKAPLLALTEAIAPAHRARLARWFDALPGTTDVGCKIGATPDALQIYARGEFPVQELYDAFTAAEVPATRAVIKNGMSLFDQRDALMVGLELRGGAATGAVYAAVRRTRKVARAIQDAFGFLATVMAPSATGLWANVAPVLLEAAGEEIAYVSFPPNEPKDGSGWVKLDVAERPIAHARRVLEVLGHGEAWPAIVEVSERLSLVQWSHIGVRLSAPTERHNGAAAVFYHPIPADRPL